ncbi:MAG: hypothetical protein QOF78_2805 [Phycisphaerales bacterium]|nr:hypothetical protein [Phycisphaerales bacterium]
MLAVIATALALAAPSLAGWRRGQRLQSAGDEFLAVARHGRALAIANNAVHRLYVDPANGTYWLMAQDGQQFVNLGTGMGRVFGVPDGCRIAMIKPDANEPLEFVEFYPTGRMQPPASVIMTGEGGDTYAFETPSPSEGLIVVATPHAQAVPQ